VQPTADHRPLHVLLIGAGKFGAMFLSKVRREVERAYHDVTAMRD
jgi:predicted homoserine dehydrogenase-like protein